MSSSPANQSVWPDTLGTGVVLEKAWQEQSASLIERSNIRCRCLRSEAFLRWQREISVTEVGGFMGPRPLFLKSLNFKLCISKKRIRSCFPQCQTTNFQISIPSGVPLSDCDCWRRVLHIWNKTGCEPLMDRLREQQSGQSVSSC